MVLCVSNGIVCVHGMSEYMSWYCLYLMVLCVHGISECMSWYDWVYMVMVCLSVLSVCHGIVCSWYV